MRSTMTTSERLRAALGVCLATFLALVVAVSWPADAFGQRSRAPHPHSQAYLHYSLGRLLEVSGGLADALVQFRRADALDPGNCEITVAMARALYGLGQMEEARAKSGRAVTECPEGIEARAVHAEILLISGEPDRAERLLRDHAGGREAPREFAVMYGQALLSQGKIEEGADFLSARAKRDSLDADVASMLGRAMLLLGDSEGAVLELKRAARLDPGDRSVLGMLARLLVTLERPDEGVPMLEWIVERRRPIEAEFISLAAGYSMQERPELAHAALDSAAAKFGESAAILRARGATFFGEDDLEGALESYEQLLEHNPDSVTALNFVAYTLADEDRDLDRALGYARRAVELESDNPFLRDTLGWAYFRLGELDEAKRELVLALELGGESPIILEHLGDVYLEAGEVEEAVDTWLRALELAPGTPTTVERLENAGADVPEELRREDDEPGADGDLP